MNEALSKALQTAITNNLTNISEGLETMERKVTYLREVLTSTMEMVKELEGCK